MGVIAANVTPGDGAVVVQMYTLGGQMRTRLADAGLSLGAARRSYIYSSDAAGLPTEGWHYLWVPLPATDPVAIHSESIGVEVRLAAPATSATLGFHEAVVLAQVGAGESLAMQLDYTTDEPAITRLRICRGSSEC